MEGNSRRRPDIGVPPLGMALFLALLTVLVLVIAWVVGENSGLALVLYVIAGMMAMATIAALPLRGSGR